ncbi:protoglobin domain-containing protein [Cryobacterium sp. HLT2-28]|uniref:protoglobin domain-containing protein n=1 Tax=Cryobacterium sp. HLT2-28 TaxID=1259146 RepID=UPI00106A3970|nr:protoglobin domain-containing protein [Cryobacterium sp. HLT2-28]TFB97531.1 protogloblin ApPgb [Cryobacterium sp. HLT2-28]
MNTDTIPGYGYDTAAPSPVSPAELAELKQSLLFTDDDAAALLQAGDVLEGQVDAILDVWYGFVGSHPHLLRYFSTPDGDPLPDYLDRVRARFGQWILDTCRRPYDARWLAYADEIGRRHVRPHKNETDAAPSVPLVPLRHMIAFIYPITATIGPFLAGGGHSDAEVERMHQAWFKAVTLQLALWARPYAVDGTW